MHSGSTADHQCADQGKVMSAHGSHLHNVPAFTPESQPLNFGCDLANFMAAGPRPEVCQ